MIRVFTPQDTRYPYRTEIETGQLQHLSPILKPKRIADRSHAPTRMTLDERMKAAWIKSLGEEAARKKEKRYYKEMSPEGTSALVVFLASDAADNVNGYVFDTMYGGVAIYREPGIQSRRYDP